MNAKIRAHVAQFNERMGFGTSEDDIIDTIRESCVEWSGDEAERRWWTERFTVVNVDGMMIGFDDATTTGDDSPSDKGWEFDPSTICEVSPREVTITVYDRL